MFPRLNFQGAESAQPDSLPISFAVPLLVLVGRWWGELYIYASGQESVKTLDRILTCLWFYCLVYVYIQWGQKII